MQAFAMGKYVLCIKKYKKNKLMSEEIFCAKVPAKFQSNRINLNQYLTASEKFQDIKCVTG